MIKKGITVNGASLLLLGIAHKEFMALDYTSLRKENSVVYDVKGVLGNNVDGKL